ncbi:branched-chain amino acid ABC transporter substrate-binding protein [Cognaticolwellia beringensis]|uniref:Branched-chain amino acid ABC transporter substrate-binding protein n=2 Tax=Cognaticolwellia beringensis TaxID=1967665 RepID=A0A222G5N2_9GAMM|nr:branched-chain amino acid ABC transporter substrate-binding protein [Cognaticolwellia beringensis]
MSIMSIASLTATSQSITIDISYLNLDQQRPTNVLNIFNTPKNSGYMGAKLAIDDSNTTGKFLQQHFNLHYFTTPKSQEFLTYLDSEYQQGRRIFILDAPLSDLVKVDFWAKNKPVLLFNVSESADELRTTQCLAQVFHTIPSNAMKSDALAQWLLYRRMNKVLLVHGSKPEDIALATSFKRSAKRFGLKLIDEKQWDFNTDLRRSTQQEIPLFTQTVQDYDVVYVADKSKTFAEFLPFNTYLPRPVIGSAGLEALAWHGVIEQWGATQLQNRFNDLADRAMNEMDFAAYIAVRSVAQSVHKLHSNDSSKLQDFINSEKFELAAYKGRKLGFRSWNRQLRMPLALVHPHALVSQSPQPGMLHPITELDTLGFDVQESHCK